MRDPSQDNDREPAGSGFSRRDFLKGSSAAVAVSSTVAAATESLAEDNKKQERIASAKPGPVKLTVNGKTHTLELEPRVTLLDALRNDLNLTGAKDVCDTTNCGACTVIIDGKPVLSCTRLAVEVQGKKITTAESLLSGQKADEVLTAFIKHDATQCGFCTPGFVVAMRAFLNKNPEAGLDEIRSGLGGNICRCGTYQGVTQAALELCQHAKTQDAKKGAE